MPLSASIRLNGNGSKVMPDTRKNERCDELARAAASNPTLDDVGYQPES